MKRYSTVRGTAVLALLALGACDASRSTSPVEPVSGPAYSLAGTTVSVTNSNGTPLVSWNAVSGALSYTVSLITYRTVNGAYHSRSFTTLTTTTGTSYLDTARSYTGVYQCEGDTSMDPVVGYWYEYGVTVNYSTGSSYVARHYAPITSAECGW